MPMFLWRHASCGTVVFYTRKCNHHSREVRARSKSKQEIHSLKQTTIVMHLHWSPYNGSGTGTDDCWTTCESLLEAISRSLLPAGDRIRPISWFGKARCAVLVPSKFLSPDGSRGPSVGRVAHPMVHNPILASIRALDETRMSHPVRILGRVLIKDGILVLPPVIWIHRITIGNQLQQAQAVIPIV